MESTLCTPLDDGFGSSIRICCVCAFAFSVCLLLCGSVVYTIIGLEIHFSAVCDCVSVDNATELVPFEIDRAMCVCSTNQKTVWHNWLVMRVY